VEEAVEHQTVGERLVGGQLLDEAVDHGGDVVGQPRGAEALAVSDAAAT
jgi:hypothetical protein